MGMVLNEGSEEVFHVRALLNGSEYHSERKYGPTGAQAAFCAPYAYVH